MAGNLQLDLDNDFEKIGQFGLYQLFILVLLSSTSIIPAIYDYSYVFIGATPDYRCQIPNYTNDTYEATGNYHQTLIDFFIPKKEGEYEKCELNEEFNYNTSFVNYSNHTHGLHNFTKNTRSCDGWVFSKIYYGQTLVTDWELVCEKAHIKSSFSTLYFVGLYGILIMAVIADKLGRKKCIYVYMILNAIVCLLIALIVNLNINLKVKQIFYGIFMFLIGMFCNFFSISIVLGMEITGPKYRVTAANCMNYAYIAGEYLTVLICNLIKDYKNLYICLSCIMIGYPLFFWIVPESPRWLLFKGKNEEAVKVLKRIAESNKKELPRRYEQLLLERNHETTNDIEINKQNGFLKTLQRMLRSRKQIIRTIVIAFNWLTNTFVYYGISMGVDQLVGNPYLIFLLLVTIELFAAIASHFAYEKYGRKIPYAINMGVGGLTLMAILVIPKSFSTLIIIVALIGKFTISFTYQGIYVITSEIYPTVVRNTAMSICQIFSRLGTVIVPYINFLGVFYWYPLPFIIYGSFASISTILTIFLIPETKNTKLPETFDDMDE